MMSMHLPACVASNDFLHSFFHSYLELKFPSERSYRSEASIQWRMYLYRRKTKRKNGHNTYSPEIH